MINTELKQFYDFLFTKNKRYYRSCSTINNGFFSRNIFIDDFKSLEMFVYLNKEKDCYINYQPLHTNKNRKTSNVSRITVIALDIEMVQKQRPETEQNLNYMLEYINYYLKIHNITNYMIVCSGNGYHLYMKLKTSKIINESNLSEIKATYKKVIIDIANEINGYSGNTISLDDRKDIAGILRIPGTMNTKINKQVNIIKVNYTGENKWLTYIWGKYLRQTRRQFKMFELSNDTTLSDSLKNVVLPKNLTELAKSPLVKIRMDKTLTPPKENEWHKCIVFAIQSLVYHSGLSNHPMINEFTSQYNIKCDCSVNFNTCSYTKDFTFPIKLAIQFCKKNGYKQYEKEIRKMYYKK